MLQQPLPLYKTADKTFEEFVIGDNGEAVAAVENWARGRGPWFILLWGNAGVGKSHLVQAALRESSNQARQVMYLPLGLIEEMGPEVLDDLGALNAIGIDDIGTVVGRKTWEIALFSVFNALQENGSRLLITAGQNPRFATFVLADLQSRLCSGLSYQVLDLGDEQKKQYLRNRAERRDLAMPDSVADYIVTHHGRNLHDLSALFESLDNATLAAGRALTVPLREGCDCRDGDHAATELLVISWLERVI